MTESQSKKSEKAVKSTGAIVAEMELTINAPRSEVWNAFVNDIGKWWHKDFYASKTPATFKLELELGGKMYEDAGNGAGVVWFTILGIEPEESLYTVGYCRPPFGGPNTGLVVFSLEEKSESETIFKVSDTTHGVVSEELAGSAAEGWRMLFSELKRFVESRYN